MPDQRVVCGMSTSKRITSRFKIVVVDETYGWRDDIVAQTGKIETVYLYDERVETFLCEMTPSYRLIPLYYLTEKQISDDLDEIMRGEAMDDTYMHVPTVDAMRTIDLRKHVANVRFTNSESKHYKDALEAARESLTSNHIV
mgnify:CR=1 FL=1